MREDAFVSKAPSRQRVKKRCFWHAPCRMKGFILHGKAAEMIFLRCAPKNRPAPPAKPVDTMKNEGLAALHCILLYV